MTGQTARTAPVSPFPTKHGFGSTSATVHITKIKCERSGHGDRRFRLYCTVITGKSKGFELSVPMLELEAERTFKYWTDLGTMPTDQEYTFDIDDQPIASIVYENHQPHHASDIQADYGHRAKVIADTMTAAGLKLEHHIYDNRQLGELREKVVNFDTTAQAKEWATEYIKEHTKPVEDIPDTVLDELDEMKRAGEKMTDELDEALERSVITHDQKTRGEYFARANAIFKRYEFEDAEWDWRSKEALGNLTSHDDYKGESIDAAVRTIALYCMDKKPDHEAVMQDFKMLMLTNGSQLTHFKAATGYANRADAYQNGKKASELYVMVEQWLEGRKKKSNGEAPKSNDEPTLPPTTPNQPQQNGIEWSSAPVQSTEPTVVDADFVDTTPKSIANVDQSTGEIIEDKPKALTVLTPSAIMTEATTLTGIPVGQIAEYLNRPYKANSPNDNPYREIQGPGGKKWTDLKGNYVRDRFDKVFGPHGIGWKIAPHPTLSKITCTPSTEKAGSGERAGFLCVMENYIFQYSIVVNGGLMWVDGSVLSDADFNADMGYAYRSAWTRIMKQALRSFGGFNHFIGKAS